MTELLSLSHNDRHYTACTPNDLLAAGVPQPVIDTALEGERLKSIKAECGRRIYQVASAETQMNIATSAAVIGGKTAASRSSDETAILAAAGMAIDWVAAMQASIATLAADADLDFKADASWLPCPAEVISLADQF